MNRLYTNMWMEFKSFLYQKYNYLNGNIAFSIFNRGGIKNDNGGSTDDNGGSAYDKGVSRVDDTDNGNNNWSRDLEAGRSILSAYQNSSYMTWDRGSTLIFWRWPSSLHHIARDGFPSRLIHKLPSNLKLPNKMKEGNRLKLLEKLQTCLSKGYLKFVPEKLVKSYIDIFGIDKDPDDIRMVSNGASCGINDSLLASNFWLPMSNTMTRLLSFGY